jgi:hypothetical protein
VRSAPWAAEEDGDEPPHPDRHWGPGRQLFRPQGPLIPPGAATPAAVRRRVHRAHATMTTDGRLAPPSGSGGPEPGKRPQASAIAPGSTLSDAPLRSHHRSVRTHPITRLQSPRVLGRTSCLADGGARGFWNPGACWHRRAGRGSRRGGQRTGLRRRGCSVEPALAVREPVATATSTSVARAHSDLDQVGVCGGARHASGRSRGAP